MSGPPSPARRRREAGRSFAFVPWLSFLGLRFRLCGTVTPDCALEFLLGSGAPGSIFYLGLGFALSCFVIPSGATRSSFPRRSLARRVAQSRDRGTISLLCNRPVHLASATRHSERSPRSEVRFSIARFLCDESLFAFSASLCALSASALSSSDSMPRCTKSSGSARRLFAHCGLAILTTAAIHDASSSAAWRKWSKSRSFWVQRQRAGETVPQRTNTSGAL